MGFQEYSSTKRILQKTALMFIRWALPFLLKIHSQSSKITTSEIRGNNVKKD